MLKEEISVSTDDLFLMLENSRDISSDLDKIPDNINTAGFHRYLTFLMREKSVKALKLSIDAQLSRSFTYQICAGDRVPSRNIILRIAFALKLTLEETQRLLKLANRGILYPRARRDAVLIYAISHKCGLLDANELLEKQGQEPLFGDDAE